MARNAKKLICAVCFKGLRGVEHCGGRVDLCSNPECSEKARAAGNRGWRTVEPNQIRCAWFDCGNFIPAGIYRRNATFLSCCQHCYLEAKRKRTRLTCGYEKCGREFYGVRGQANRRAFCCSNHHTLQCREEFLDQQCGKFRSLFDEYYQHAQLRLRELRTVRSGLGLLFQFMNESNLETLDDVSPAAITSFLHWGATERHPSVWNAIWPIATFMRWAFATGRRKTPNPVVPRFHSRRKPKRLPRPYSEEEMKRIWRILEQRGSTVTRLAVAIAEETGLRISEIANLRLQDMELKRQRLFVRLPNKTSTEAFVPFNNGVVKYLRKWSQERGKNLPHDYLLHNEYGRPYSKGSLHRALCRVFCMNYGGKHLHEDGLDSWSTHRLRHTLASRLARGGADAAAIMAIGRWVSYSAMVGYSKVDEEQKAAGYREAMDRAQRAIESPSRVTEAFRKGASIIASPASPATSAG